MGTLVGVGLDGKSLAFYWAIIREHPSGLYLPTDLMRRLWCHALDVQPTTYRAKLLDGLVDRNLLQPVGRNGWIIRPPPPDLPRPLTPAWTPETQKAPDPASDALAGPAP